MAKTWIATFEVEATNIYQVRITGRKPTESEIEEAFTNGDERIKFILEETSEASEGTVTGAIEQE